MKAGPKTRVDDTPLSFRTRSTGSRRFATFAAKFVKVPKGTNAKKALRLRDWQLDLIGSVEDAEVMPRTAGWMLPRGQGKSTLVAAYGLYRFFTDGEGAVVCVVAVDERQAGIVFNIARRMVELDDELSSRVQVFKEKLYWPATATSTASQRRPPLSRDSTTRWQSSMRLVWRIGTPTRCCRSRRVSGSAPR